MGHALASCLQNYAILHPPVSPVHSIALSGEFHPVNKSYRSFISQKFHNSRSKSWFKLNSFCAISYSIYVERQKRHVWLCMVLQEGIMKKSKCLCIEWNKDKYIRDSVTIKTIFRPMRWSSIGFRTEVSHIAAEVVFIFYFLSISLMDRWLPRPPLHQGWHLPHLSSSYHVNHPENACWLSNSCFISQLSSKPCVPMYCPQQTDPQFYYWQHSFSGV